MSSLLAEQFLGQFPTETQSNVIIYWLIVHETILSDVAAMTNPFREQTNDAKKTANLMGK